MTSVPKGMGVLQLEPTDLCDLRCQMCQPHHRPHLPGSGVHGVPSGFMEMSLFRKILRELLSGDSSLDHLILQWMGEPFLHPAMEEMIGLACAALGGKADYVRVDTNGINLTPPRIDSLLRHWLPQAATPLLLVFSLDAVDEGTYLRVKGRSELDTVHRNIRYLLARRASLSTGGASHAPLNLQFQFVVQPGNHGEASRFVEYWLALLACQGKNAGHDEILLKRLSVGSGGSAQEQADALYDDVLAKHGLGARPGPPAAIVTWERRPWRGEPPEGHSAPRPPCSAMWTTPVVRHDGDLTMCCADLGARLSLGSLARHSFRELWEGPEATRRRLAHVKGAFHQLEPCANCAGFDWYRLEPMRVRRWLESVDRQDLWPEYAERMGLATS